MWTQPAWIYRVLSSLSVFFMTLDVETQGASGDTTADVDRHLELGKKLLAAGQLTEALSHYHAAVEGDPENYLTYFKRAAVFLALGRSKTALPDLDMVLTLRPDFMKARIERANIYLKQGELELASSDFEFVLSRDTQNQDALTKISMIEPIMEDVKRAKEQMKYGDYHGAIASLASALEVCPWDPSLRELRAQCYEMTGDYVKAIGDLRPTTKLKHDNTEGHYRISTLHYRLGEADEALKEIRECLKLDQEHKACHQHYKKVKKLVKLTGDAEKLIEQQSYSDAIFKLNAALKVEKDVEIYQLRIKRLICHCHLKENRATDAILMCNHVLEKDPQNIDALCDRGEAYILDENFEEAVRDFQAAKNINGDYRRAQEGLEKGQRLLKQSKKRDYYKILGVKRHASKREILKAYRKLAAKWHPDNYKGQDRKLAEKKFIEVAAAKEVLADPEKRAKFDNGEDPLDPEQQNNPFQGWEGGFPFGGEGFNFKFHFD